MQEKDFTLALIGAGNMGEALLGGVLRAGMTSRERIIASDISVQRLEKIAKEFSVKTTQDNLEALQDAQVVLLAVKPQNLPALAQQLKGHLRPGQLVISILAGIPLSRLREALGSEPTIVRVMPNLPALIGEGISVIADDGSQRESIQLVRTILETVGEVILLPEEYLDAVTALSGSGPGFVYLFVEALSEAGQAVGLPPEAARRLAEKTFIGACRLLETTEESPSELRRRVTSPGGTTAAGIEAFEELGLRDIFKAALERSARRASELGRG